MNYTIIGKRMRSLRIFKNILDAWIKLNIRYAEVWKSKDDIPWWYNERALLSVLSGAVWLQKGGMAFEEYSTDKKWKPQRRIRSKTYKGRQDIYIRINSHEFIGEAKDVWSAATPKNMHPAKRINAGMDHAVKAIKNTCASGEKRLAILFVRPYMKIKYFESIDKYVKDWIKKIRKGVDYSCCAWVFPRTSRTFTGKDNNIYPGIALFIKEI